MGLLSIFSKGSGSNLLKLPSGSFTVDAAGKIITSTIPQSFPENLLKELGHAVLQIFQEAVKAQSPLNEFEVQYAALKITGRELRGGAIIFLTPRQLG